MKEKGNNTRKSFCSLCRNLPLFALLHNEREREKGRRNAIVWWVFDEKQAKKWRVMTSVSEEETRSRRPTRSHFLTWFWWFTSSKTHKRSFFLFGSCCCTEDRCQNHRSSSIWHVPVNPSEPYYRSCSKAELSVVVQINSSLSKVWKVRSDIPKAGLDSHDAKSHNYPSNETLFPFLQSEEYSNFTRFWVGTPMLSVIVSIQRVRIHPSGPIRVSLITQSSVRKELSELVSLPSSTRFFIPISFFFLFFFFPFICPFFQQFDRLDSLSESSLNVCVSANPHYLAY